jgi:two-component system nitrogen regulation sensor histidine kinase NtrY
MTEKRFMIFLVFLSGILLVMSLATESVYFSNFEDRMRTSRFTKILHEKEAVMEECLNGMKPVLARGEPHGSLSEKDIFANAARNQITILEYIDKKLIYWSDNSFDVPFEQNDTLFAKPLVFIKNGWFLPHTVQASNEMIVGLLRIHTDFGFENDIIKNGFEKDFRMPASVGFSNERSPSGYNIYDRSGTFLFSLSFPETRQNTVLILIPLAFWLSFFVFIILLMATVSKIMDQKGKPLYGLLASLLVFILIYFLLLFLNKPAVLFRTSLFSPFVFSLNRVIPSLGHLLVLSVFAAVLSSLFYKYVRVQPHSAEKPWQEYIVMTLLFGAGALLILVFHLIFSQLISDSNITFEAYKVLNLTFFSVAGISAVIMLLLVPFLLILKIFQAGISLRNSTLILSFLTSLAIIAVLSSILKNTMLPVLLFYSGIVIIVWLSVRKSMNRFNISVIFSLILALYSLYLITYFSEKKTTENLKIQAVSFSTDNDPEAEHMLIDMWPMISNDRELGEMMDVDFFEKGDFDIISSYLNDTYFKGYWGNYNINLYLCAKNDSLRLGQSGENSENCFTFFNDRTSKYGHRLTGTEFYFIDNQGGRSAYLGKLQFRNSAGSENGLYIELYSDINVFQPGYSELLLDKKFRGYSGLKDYSFIKYINGELVLESGGYPYNKSDVEYVGRDSDYRVFKDAGYNHVLYRNGNATVIISRPALKAGDLVISFAYLFAFIFLFANFLILLLRRPDVKVIGSFNFRQKLQLSFIGILTISFVLIGVVVALLTIRQFQAKHYENIREKLNSIYLELDSKLSAEKQLSPDWRSTSYSSLNEMLIKLSNIFNTDINLYDLQGFLMATSRPEIFIRNLNARRMNNDAYIYYLANPTKSDYIQTEKVGKLKYISAYIPFYNSDNNLIAYLDLPYFRMQSMLTREISNLIVAVINFTLLLILITMSLAVFISSRLTSPLSMLSEGLASVELGKKIKRLPYSGNDEIGDLVKQYNRMVDELEESAHKLANSEREYAWREMAKQIAHEIKNPLTPMKLNVQQLLKSWKDGVPGFDKKIEAFSKNQIDYIDNLSTIATAFSSFAKMPGTNPGVVNLPENIKTTLELFRNTDNINFRVRWPHESKVFIYADKEHLNGLFSNLFKNSIQAIPQGREGLIKVAMEIKGDRVIVSVSDNGTGIPESLQKKMFTPNFTTKSSGTGLGLSIVKKYVEGANGKIWFESGADEGTTFYIEFPLLYTIEKPGEGAL